MRETTVHEDIIGLVLDNLKNLFYPEELLDLDLKLAKSELLALMVLDRQDELTMGELAERLHMPVNTTTGLVSRLVSAGYLMRERSEADRRLVLIRPTGEGREIADRLKAIIGNYVRYIAGVLTEDEQSALLSIVLKIMEALKKKGAWQDHSDASPELKKIEIE